MIRAEVEHWPRTGGKAFAVPVKEAPLLWQEKGLSYTASGYGLKIPSRYMVQFRGRWRRVYICQMGNAGTAFLGSPGAWVATVDIWHDGAEVTP